MLHPRILLAGTVAAGLVVATGARAAPPTKAVTAELEEDEAVPRVVLGVAAGAAVSLVSLGTGAMLIARSDEREVRNAGLLGIHGGLGLSPLVAHAIAGELGRGALFSLVPLAMGAGTATLMGSYPGFLTFITHRGPLDAAPDLYRTFARKRDGCIKPVLVPNAA